MTQSLITGCERVKRMLRRQDQDRVPRYDVFWTETIARWQQEGLEGDGDTVLEMMEHDFHQTAFSWPAPFPGQTRVLEEDEQTRVCINEWGATERRWKTRSGTPEHLAFGCMTRQDWEQRYKPAYLKLDPAIDAEQARSSYRRGREGGQWCFLNVLESFESTRRMMGDEVTMIAMADDPEWVLDVTRTYTDAVLRRLETILAMGIEPDGIWIFGDMAYKHGTFCSPAMYREMIWPDHKRLADWAHARDLDVIFHTDGDVNAVVDLYVEAGFDCLQPLEVKANMDIRKLVPRYGQDLAFFGNIDVMIMASNDRERIEAEIASKFAAGMSTRGYAYHSDHSVPPMVSWATYQFILDRVKHYGQYD